MLPEPDANGLLDRSADVDHSPSVVEEVNAALAAEIDRGTADLLTTEQAGRRLPQNAGTAPVHAERIDKPGFREFLGIIGVRGRQVGVPLRNPSRRGRKRPAKRVEMETRLPPPSLMP